MSKNKHLSFKDYSVLSDAFRKLMKKNPRSKLVKVLTYPSAWLVFEVMKDWHNEHKAKRVKPVPEKFEQKYNHKGEPTYQYKKENNG